MMKDASTLRGTIVALAAIAILGLGITSTAYGQTAGLAFRWDVSLRGYEVTGRGQVHGSVTDIVIPATHNGHPVRGIGSGAFRNQGLTSVLIPNGILEIDDDAFRGNQLTSVTIPDSVEFIGDDAFRGNQLTSVTIPDSVGFIGDNAFRGNQLTSVTIGNGVEIIGERAFFGNRLTSVSLPRHTWLGGHANDIFGRGVTVIRR